MNKGKLIYADELLRVYKGWIPQLMLPEDAGDKRGVETCIAFLEDTTAVDAVEVVRCKDCKYREDERVCPMCFVESIDYDDDGYIETDYIYHDITVDNGFCYIGEKWEDEEE